MDLETFNTIQGDVVPVVKYDPFNQANNTALREVSTPIDAIDEYVIFVSNSLKKTLYFYNAAGISAPQIGINKRIIAINSTLNYTNLSESEILILINPEIISDTDDEDLLNGMEGCLSFPESFVAVLRPKSIRVKYKDLKGDDIITTFSGDQARAIIHEIEHLDGKLIIDNVSGLKKNLILDKQKKMYRTGDINNDRLALNLVKNI